MATATETVVKVILVVWTTLCGLVSLVGNTTVLISSLKYNAITLDRVSVCLINNLALSDLLTVLITILPTLPGIFTQRWVFGDVMCTVIAYLEFYVGATSTYLLCGFTVSKLTSLLFPLDARLRSGRTGRIIAAIIWLTVAILATAQLKAEVLASYDSKVYRCHNVSAWPKKFRLVVAILVIYIPVAVVGLSSLGLILFMKRVRGNSRQAIVSLLSISSIYAVSVLPFGITIVLEAYDCDPGNLVRFAHFIAYLNWAANPVVYLFTVRSFRAFITDKTKIARRKIGDVTISQP